MVIFINGSFGIGKTTVARALVEALPGSLIFDPEPFGIVLAHLVGLWPISRRMDDFQDLRAWRRVSVHGINLVGRLRKTVIVPMAISNVSYLDEFLQGVRKTNSETFHFCLTAPLTIVQERLRLREQPRGPSSWQLRRSNECCELHRQTEFAEHISTEDRSVQEITNEIRRRISTRG